MTMPKGTKPVMGQMTARASEYLTGLAGPVILAYGASGVRITGYLRNRIGNFGAKPRYRKFAVRPESPESAAFSEGSAVTDETSFSQDLSLNALGANMFIQPALGCAVTSGTAGAEAFGFFQAWTDNDSRIVASQTLQLEPWANSGKISYIPIGKPFPAFKLSGVMIAVAARGVSGFPTMNFVGRTFTGDPTIGSAWDTASPLLESNKTFSSTAEDYNTGNLAYAPADVAYAQIGVKFPQVDDAHGTFDIIVAAKY